MSVKRFKVIVDDSDIDRVMARIRSGLPQGGEGQAQGAFWDNKSYYQTHAGEYGYGRGWLRTSKSMYSPLTEHQEQKLSQRSNAVSSLWNLSRSDEMGDYLSFGYMDRTVRSFLSRIPGMSELLHVGYRARNIGVGLKRGFTNLSDIYDASGWTGMGWTSLQAQSIFRTNLAITGIGIFQASASIGLILIMVNDLIESLRNEQKRWSDELRESIQSSTGLNWKQYKMWQETQKQAAASTVQW